MLYLLSCFILVVISLLTYLVLFFHYWGCHFSWLCEVMFSYCILAALYIKCTIVITLRAKLSVCSVL